MKLKTPEAWDPTGSHLIPLGRIRLKSLKPDLEISGIFRCVPLVEIIASRVNTACSTYNIDIEAKKLWSKSPKGFVFNGSETTGKMSADWMTIDIYSCTMMYCHVSCHWLVRIALRLNANLSILKQKTDSGNFYQLTVVEIIRSRSCTWMPNNLPSPQRNTGSRPSCPLSMLNFWVAIYLD